MNRVPDAMSSPAGLAIVFVAALIGCTTNDSCPAYAPQCPKGCYRVTVRAVDTTRMCVRASSERPCSHHEVVNSIEACCVSPSGVIHVVNGGCIIDDWRSCNDAEMIVFGKAREAGC